MKQSKPSCLSQPNSLLQCKSKFTPVLVIWEDFAIGGGWHSGEELLEAQKTPFLVHTVGFLISWDRHRLILVSGFADKNGEHGFQEIMRVPIGMIKSLRYLGEMKNVPKGIQRITKQRNNG